MRVNVRVRVVRRVYVEVKDGEYIGVCGSFFERFV